MTTDTNTAKSTRGGAIGASFGFLVGAIVFWFGLSRMASLSGELLAYDPTFAETATWISGQIFGALGGLLFVAWTITVAVLRKKLRITPLGIAVVTTAAGLVTVIVGASVWFANLPPLADSPSF